MTPQRLINYLPPEKLAAMLARASASTAAEFNGAGWLALSAAERNQIKRSL